MESRLHPDAIDVRLVFRIYAWITIASGVFIYLWPLKGFFPELLVDMDLAGLPNGRSAVLRTVATVVVASGMAAAGFSRIEDPVSRSRALTWFAATHLLCGAMFFIQWHASFSIVLPSPVLGWTPLVVGAGLLYIALTSAHAPRLRRPFRHLFQDGALEGPVLVNQARGGAATGALRSRYEEQIREAARVEERSRLARDLHDAVKQQIFAIHTSAATAQERLTSDTEGAHLALEQVRSSARDAMTEMDALIGQLQSAPVENTGLVSALRQQCEALELRTGATVHFEADALPPSDRLPPGAQQALYRVAQEALANVARHARARHVHVRLTASANSVELAVRDDGTGFNQSASRTRGMGLQNMGARVAEIGGAILVQSAPGKGTIVAFSVPCDTNTSHDYARKAIFWVAAAALSITALNAVGGSDRPWYVIVVAVVSLTAARFVAAWYRVRHTRQGDRMSMLTLVPRRWYSWDFDLVDRDRRLAGLEMSWWRERGILSVEGVEHRVYRESLAGDFVLERDGQVLARATKPSVWTNSFVLSCDGRQYSLRKRSMWRREFVVCSGATEIGSLVPRSMWSRTAQIALPPDWPLAIRAFVIWLTIIIWKRESDSAGVAASSS
jgi:signal transduction histidine kinase